MQMKSCMETMIDQLMDTVVERFENAAEEHRNKKDEIRRGKQVEATTEEEEMSDIVFEPGATFSEEEIEKVARVIERMQVDEEELDASKHAPVIPPGEKRKEFLRFTPSGQVTIAKRPVTAPAGRNKRRRRQKNRRVGKYQRDQRQARRRSRRLRSLYNNSRQRNRKKRRRRRGRRRRLHHQKSNPNSDNNNNNWVNNKRRREMVSWRLRGNRRRRK